MAHVHQNTIAKGLRGRVGDLIYKQYGDKTVVTRVPQFSGAWSKRQIAARRRFGRASRYATEVQRDPARLAIYARVARKRKLTVRATAIADFLTAPTINEIDPSRYQGRPGDVISIWAHDNFEVVAVEVTIRDARGELVESGPAQRDAAWRYVAQKTFAGPAPWVIEARATDRPGNATTRTV